MSGKWSRDEDDKLKNLCSGQDKPRWTLISQEFESKTAKQCRDRWTCYLKPDLKNQDIWTIEEDNLLVKLQKELGNHWKKISKVFEGKSENSVKNRWYSSVRKRVVNSGAGEIVLRDAIKRGKPKSTANKICDTLPIPEMKGNATDIPSQHPFSTNTNSLPLFVNAGLNFIHNRLPTVTSLINRDSTMLINLTNPVNPMPHNFLNRNGSNRMSLSNHNENSVSNLIAQDNRPKVTFSPQTFRLAPSVPPSAVSNGPNFQSTPIPRRMSLMNSQITPFSNVMNSSNSNSINTIPPHNPNSSQSLLPSITNLISGGWNSISGGWNSISSFFHKII